MDLVSKNQRSGTSYQSDNDWTNFIRENNLRSVQEIPDNYRAVFSNFTYFNKIQSKVFDDVYYTDNPVVISSPTGSGKTVIFELAIIRFLINLELINRPNAYKMVYISPLKALCDERLLDWHNKFGSLGANCISVTGDNENYDLYNLKNFSLIITTPEKWDSLTRKWRNNKILMQSIKLFMIDEVHLLNEDIRGSTLEAVLNRMKIVEETLRYEPLETNIELFKTTRFMAVSATIPNIEDVAEWLGNSLVPAKCFKFGEEMRPVPLKKLVFGYSQQTNNFKFDLAMNYRLQSIILQHSMGKPTLIFCNTRKSVEMTAKHLLQNLTVHLTQDQKSRIQDSLSAVPNQSLKDFLMNGIGCHHAGLPFETRRVIESLFRGGNLGVLVTTSTLALGVNLPAHLVIIKTTKYYSGGEYKDYSESMILQMIGRAGRPQFDQSGTAVILTTTAEKKKYETLVEGHQSIESNLHKNLIEHLNAEVVLKTITDLSVAMQWITSTFLYVRARKNPKHYGLPLGLSTDQIDRKLLDMCQIEINKLANTGLLTIDQSDITISPTLSGCLMAKYYIAYETMKLFTKMSGKEALQQVLGIISKCNEFSDIHLRTDEKKTLNMINKSKDESIRFPLSGRITTSDMKVNCIIQAVFGCLPISDYSLNNESLKIMRTGERLSKCLAEHLETKENGYSALLSALILAKCFHTQLWEQSKYVSRQLPGIGNVLSCQLATAGKTSFQSILDSNPRDLERIMNRKPPFGNTIQDKVKFLPFYELSLIKQENDKEILLIVAVTLKNSDDLKITSTVNLNSFMNLLVGEPNGNTIYLYEKYVHTNFLNEPCIQKQISIPLSDDMDIVNAHFISEDWVGIDKEATVILKQNYKEKDDSIIFKKKTQNKQPNAPQKTKIQTLMDNFFKNNKSNNNSNQKKKNSTTKKVSAELPKTPQKEILSLQTKQKPEDDNIQLNNNNNENISPPNVHEKEISSIKNEELPKSNNISPGSLRKSMEEYVRDNVKDYDQLFQLYGGSMSPQNKTDKSDGTGGNIGVKLPSKPSLVRKLSNIVLEEKNLLPEQGESTHNTSVSSAASSSIPPQNMPFFSTLCPKIATSRKYPRLIKRNPQKLTQKFTLGISNFEFEKSLMAPGPLSPNDCLQEILKVCAKEPEDKLNHDLIRSTKQDETPRLSSNGNYYVAEIIGSESQKVNNMPENSKSISWGSPLVSSPQQKYSPNIPRDRDVSKLSTCNTTSETVSSDNLQENFFKDNFSDVLSNSLIESIEKLSKEQSDVLSHQKEPQELKHPEKRLKISECPVTFHHQLDVSQDSMIPNTADLTFPSRGSENNCSFSETFIENRPKFGVDPQEDYNRYDSQEETCEPRGRQYNTPRNIGSPFSNYDVHSQQNHPRRNFYDEFPRSCSQHHYPQRDVTFMGQYSLPSTSRCCHHGFPRGRPLREMDHYYNTQPDQPRYFDHQRNFGGPYDKENEFQLGNRNPRSNFTPNNLFHNNSGMEIFEKQERRDPHAVPMRDDFEEVHKSFDRRNINFYQSQERENFGRNRFSPNFDQLMRPHTQSRGDYYENPGFLRRNTYQEKYTPTVRRPELNYPLFNNSNNGNPHLQDRYPPMNSPHQHRFQ